MSVGPLASRYTMIRGRPSSSKRQFRRSVATRPFASWSYSPMSQPLPPIVVFGDDGFLTEHTAAHRFVSLLADGLRSQGAEVTLSCDRRTERRSIGGRALRSIRRVPSVPSRAIVLYYGQALSTLFVLAIWCRLKRSLLVPYVVEWPPAVPMDSWLSGLNARCFGAFVFRLADGVVLISTELEGKAQFSRPRLPRIVLPVMSEVESRQVLPSGNADLPPDLPADPYVAFCADLNGYLHDALFLIDVIGRTEGACSLVLVGAPDKSSMQQIAATAASRMVAKRVTVLSHLSDQQLRAVYARARVLLMPLSDDERTRARFPSKLGDYLLSGRPVLTSRVGETGRLLGAGDCVAFAQPMDARDWARSLNDLLEDPDHASDLGERGMVAGVDLFDHRLVTSNLATFLRQLASNTFQRDPT